MFPNEQQHPTNGHGANGAPAPHGAVPQGHPGHGAAAFPDGAPPQFPAGDAAGGQAGAYGPFPGGAPAAFAAGGGAGAAPGAGGVDGGGAAGGNDQVPPQSDWTPAQWLEYILRRSTALEQSINGIRHELRVSDARADAARDTAREIVREFSHRLQHQSTAKTSTPETFHGRTSEDISQWLFSLEQYFLASRVTDPNQQVNFAASLLRGSAALWWRQLVEDSGRPNTWAQFSTSIRYQFVTTNTSIETRYHLSNLHQKSGHGVTEYARQCVALCLRLRDMSETDKVFYFVKGLRKPEVRRDVLSRNPDSLADAIRLAEISDSSLYPGSSYRMGHISNRRPHIFPSDRSRNDYRRGSPMDLDNAQTGRPVLRYSRGNAGSRVPANTKGTFRGRQGNGRNGGNEGKYSTGNSFKTKQRGNCFKCGKPGHYAYQCRQKNPQNFHNVETEFCTFADTSSPPSCKPLEDLKSQEGTQEGAISTSEETSDQEYYEGDQEGDEVSYSSECETGREMDKEGRIDDHLN